eukprot:34835-Rhodomonas_salina.1
MSPDPGTSGRAAGIPTIVFGHTWTRLPRYSGTPDTGTRVLRLGNQSTVTFELRIFRCYAECGSTEGCHKSTYGDARLPLFTGRTGGSESVAQSVNLDIYGAGGLTSTSSSTTSPARGTPLDWILPGRLEPGPARVGNFVIAENAGSHHDARAFDLCPSVLSHAPEGEVAVPVRSDDGSVAAHHER